MKKIFLLITLIIYYPIPADACDCRKQKVDLSYKTAHAVVQAKVIKVSDKLNSITLKIQKQWKRKVDKEIILENVYATLCPPRFQKDKIYLIYLEMREGKVRHRY